MRKQLVPLVLISSLFLVGCGADIDGAVERCQDRVSGYAKYPGTADWVELRMAEEQNGKIYVSGGADFNNDAGNPVRTKYHCTLNIETDDWDRYPTMEVQNPVSSFSGSSRWGGEASPMLEKYGDSMSLEY